MITDLLGTPTKEDVDHITSPSAVKSLRSQTKPEALSKLYQLAPSTSHGAVHLLSQMLIFNPVSVKKEVLEGRYRSLWLISPVQVGCDKIFHILVADLDNCFNVAPSSVCRRSGSAVWMLFFTHF